MRVISGTARGTKLDSLDDIATRPTLDRVKEALFNILQAHILDSTVLDLFAGSGAIGIEFLSRGAKEVTFCDNSYPILPFIQRNLQKTKFENKANIIKSDFNKCLKKLQEENKAFDIIFLDPPYNTNMAIESVEKIIEFNLLTEDGVIIIETDDEKRILKQIQQENIHVYDNRKYGRVKLLFLNRKG